MEHHANIVPWQMLCQRTGAKLRWFGITDDGRLDLSQHRRAARRAHQGRLAGLRVSNVLGTVNPVTRDRRAGPTQAGALVVVDASQAVPHLPVDVSTLGADFVAFSGHKMRGPTGIGVLWGRSSCSTRCRRSSAAAR